MYKSSLIFFKDVNTSDFEHLLQEDWATDLTPNMLNAYKNKDYKDLTIAKLSQLMESWITKREDITTGFESVFGKLLFFVLRLTLHYIDTLL